MSAKKKQQVTVDEAVVAKGGKPGFVKQLEDATGVTAQREREAQAEQHFEKRVTHIGRRDIALSNLVPFTLNPRGDDVGDVSDLVGSMQRNGFMGALMVREQADGRFEVVQGNRRLKAAKEARLKVVPCDIYELSDVQALEGNIAEQINRADLSPLKEGEAFRKLMDLSGYSSEQVAEKVSRSPSWVRGRVALCGLAGEVKKQLVKGEVTLTVAQALAALPTQRMQVQAAEKAARASTAEDAVEAIRTGFCRPLRGAPWKLPDATLTDAGACSTCPSNSANGKTPGLFDNAKAAPMCSNSPCFETKLKAAWERDTVKAKASGAKVLTLSEGHKLYAHGTLGYDSRYVEADKPVPEDRNKLTWKHYAGKLPLAKRPVLHLAQSKNGEMHELFLRDETLKAIAEELGLKWAQRLLGGAETSNDAPATKDAEAPWEVQAKEIARRQAVQEEVAVAVANRVSVKGLTLPVVRAVAASFETLKVAQYLTATGRPNTSEKAAEKFLESSVQDELLGFIAWARIRDFDARGEFDEAFMALAEAEGFDLEAMVKARIDGEKSEAALAAKEKAA